MIFLSHSFWLFPSITILFASVTQIFTVNSFAPSYYHYLSSAIHVYHRPLKDSSLFETKPSGRILPADYYKSVYERKDEEGEDIKTPWDIGGGKPQPAVVNAYEQGQLRGRILDVGCGAGENCIYLGEKYGITSVVGSDLAEGAIRMAVERVDRMENDARRQDDGKDRVQPFWTKPTFFVASCTEIADTYKEYVEANGGEKSELFDVSIDSGLLHCLSNEDAKRYVQQLGPLVKPDTGRAFVGCFSTKNPAESWDNPRRLSPEYLRNLFCEDNGWEVISITDTWWARPPERGTSQGSFAMALWMEARRL